MGFWPQGPPNCDAISTSLLYTHSILPNVENPSFFISAHWTRKHRSKKQWLCHTGAGCDTQLWRACRGANSSSDNPHHDSNVSYSDEKRPFVNESGDMDAEYNGFVPNRRAYDHKTQRPRPCFARVLRKGLCAFAITGFIIYHLGLPYGMIDSPCFPRLQVWSWSVC